MRILVADDEPIFRKLYASLLENLGHDVVIAESGDQAWSLLQRTDAPRFAVLDWMMPGLSGVDLCSRLRGTARHRLSYFIIVTANSGKDDLVAAMDAGASDFVTKPFAPSEFLARVTVGVRAMTLQDQLLERIVVLQAAVKEDFNAMPILPVCMYCKSVRDEKDLWHEREEFLVGTIAQKLSHGICPSCDEGIVAPMLEALV